MSVLEKILTFFYPKRCLLCGRAGAVNGDELCADCAKLHNTAAGYSRAVFRVACRKTGLHTGMPCAAAVQGAVSVILVAVQVQKRDEPCETACKVNAAGDR